MHMGVITENVKELKGMKLHIIPTDKYKTNTIVLKMKAPLKRKMSQNEHFCPMFYKVILKNIPTTTLLRSYLDELYGATFYIDLGKKGIIM